MLSIVVVISFIGGALALKSIKSSETPLYTISVFRTTGIYGTVQYCDRILCIGGAKVIGSGNYYVTINNASLCTFNAYSYSEE